MPDTERIAEVSPTLLTAIQRCGLAVHLSRAYRQRRGSTPSSPPARLGTAVHRVLGWVSDRSAELGPSEFEAAVRQRWHDEVSLEEKAAAASPSESYFGPAPGWPGYATTEERLVIEAGWLAAEVSSSIGIERWVERPLSSSAPPMRGTPDLVVLSDVGARIAEFKSGTVAPEDAKPTGRFGLQVLMYAAMVRQLGIPVIAGEIRPIGRARLPVEVTDGAIEEACASVLVALDDFNSAVDEGETVRLARPSDRSCGYCPHILRCPAIWAGATKELNDLQVLEGTVERVQQAQVGSVAVELEATAGTRLGVVTITGLDPRRLSDAASLQRGEQVRVSGLRLRAAGIGGLSAPPGAWVQLARTSGEGIDT